MPSVELFVRNEKGEERVARVDVAPAHAPSPAAAAAIALLPAKLVLSGYTRHPRLLEQVEPITGEHIVSIHNMLINKPPGVDGRKEPPAGEPCCAPRYA